MVGYSPKRWDMLQNGEIFSKMVEYSPKCWDIFQNIGIFSTIVGYSPKWWDILQNLEYCPKWWDIFYNCGIFSKMVGYSPKWWDILQNGGIFSTKVLKYVSFPIAEMSSKNFSLKKTIWYFKWYLFCYIGSWEPTRSKWVAFVYWLF